ncbi:tRNA synthetase RNA-binding protein [Loktanella sp. 5RATIMAR09]|uniref:RNA-binding S4 domain-containing protein n=1 Tax=Loktanella sp. 5RATIMAR09 TaxID=1225655 RepID=UPI0006EBD30E|nr:RNA-binding S4 domain-containing protein [Loktanella sp. 5RATIMAR09]KQI71024.1 tRNA synthetase RNA-binding protein [Loktanella sp. 5RATIMAR09]
MSDPRPTIRLDKWLWHARFFKSRSLAAGVVTSGKVRVDSQPVSKPARAIGPGNVLTFVQAQETKVVRVVACGERRGPAPEAQALYEDLTPVPKPRPTGTQGANPRYEKGGRPTKKDRRDMGLD